MRVGIMSYPMLFQREGGLQIQVKETILALNGLAGAHIQAELIDPARECLADYDVLHVFAAINGNHRIVEAAVECGVPVVLSPLVSPTWNHGNGLCARLADKVLGSLTQWNVQTSYAQMRKALELATTLIALGEAESQAIRAGFLIEQDKIRVLPNGISPQFFNGNPDLFRARTGIAGPFVLMVGAISPYKNQLGMVQALADLSLPLVVIGEPQERDIAYFRELRATAGTFCLGAVAHDDPFLAGAYAAASVFALPSHGEVLPLSVLEALAAGTPVVMTSASALHLPDSRFALRQLDWNDTEGQAEAVVEWIVNPPERRQVSALVAGYTWENVARSLHTCYAELAGKDGAIDAGDTGHAIASAGGVCAV
jgi:hypothetical protein